MQIQSNISCILFPFHSLRFGEFVLKFCFGTEFRLFVAGYYPVSLNTEMSTVCNMKYVEVQSCTSARRIIYPWGSQLGIFSKEISSAPGEKIAKLSPLAGVFPHNISSVQPGGLGR